MYVVDKGIQFWNKRIFLGNSHGPHFIISQDLYPSGSPIEHPFNDNPSFGADEYGGNITHLRNPAAPKNADSPIDSYNLS